MQLTPTQRSELLSQLQTMPAYLVRLRAAISAATEQDLDRPRPDDRGCQLP